MIPQSMRPLLPYLKRYRWGFVVGALCILLSNGAQAGLPRVIGNAAQSLESGVTRHKLLIFTLQVLALAVVARHLPVSHPLDRDRNLARH